MAEYVWEEADKSNPWGRKRAKGTHCSRGHEFTEENTFIRPYDKTRVCRECRRRYARKKYQENKHAGKTKAKPEPLMPSVIPQSVFLDDYSAKLFADLQSKLQKTDVPCRSMQQIFDNPEHVSKRDAKSLCEGCPLIKECGNFAEASRQEYGIWGGVNYTKRRYKNGYEWFEVEELSDFFIEH
jgi:hypothetical protein